MIDVIEAGGSGLKMKMTMLQFAWLNVVCVGYQCEDAYGTMINVSPPACLQSDAEEK